MTTNLIDPVEIHIFEIFADTAMHPLIRGIYGKQFDATLNYQIAEYDDLTVPEENSL